MIHNTCKKIHSICAFMCLPVASQPPIYPQIPRAYYNTRCFRFNFYFVQASYGNMISTNTVDTGYRIS